jgi:hypothetical protein
MAEMYGNGPPRFSQLNLQLSTALVRESAEVTGSTEPDESPSLKCDGQIPRAESLHRAPALETVEGRRLFLVARLQAGTELALVLRKIAGDLQQVERWKD